MRRWKVGMVLGFALLAAALDARAQEVAGAREVGVAVAVGSDDGTLLLRRADAFPVIVVGHGTVISDSRGRALLLSDVRPGDRVQYVVEKWAGMSLARYLRVTPTTASASAR
jgi:hypothetical protein